MHEFMERVVRTWGTPWAAGVGLWGMGVNIWAIGAVWREHELLSTISASFMFLTLVVPIAGFVIGRMSVTHGGGSPLLTLLLQALMRPPLTSIMQLLESIATLSIVVVQAVVLVGVHPLLLVFAFVPMLIRQQIQEALS